jgi:FixJ family two-component response regulator
MAAASIPSHLTFGHMLKNQAVCVIDDDESVRESLTGMLESLDYLVRPFHSAEAFLASEDLNEIGCLILDVSMPEMNGEDLQRHLLAEGRAWPIVFISADGDESLQRRLLERGAAGYLVKPFQESELLTALRAVSACPAEGSRE